ncbi:MAG: Rrf2 family transcriptional regulator [Vicinamibacterales bacterium]
MQLSLHADYGLRLLIYLGSHGEDVVSTQRVSEAYGISKHHLVRVAQTLARHGYIQIVPGRAGGLKLAREPLSIRLGDVVRAAEPNLQLVECFDRRTNTCPIIDVCGLRAYLSNALEAFVAELNTHTLAELLVPARRRKLERVFLRLYRTPPA